MNKKGYLRTLEAIIAIVLVLIVGYVVIPKYVEPKPEPPLVVQDSERFIISDISNNESLRELIVTSNDDLAISSEVQNVISSRKPSNYDFICTICPQTNACIQASPLKKTVYMSDVFIASTIERSLSEQNPKIVRFWMWEKPTPTDYVLIDKVNTCEVKVAP